MFATTVYLHRGITHRALVVHPCARVRLSCDSLWITTGMRPREWAAVHRRHHAATDTPDDPHSPVAAGFWRVQLTNAAMYRTVARDGVTVDKYARDLPPTASTGSCSTTPVLGLGIGVTLLCVVLARIVVGILLGVLAAIVHMVGYLGLERRRERDRAHVRPPSQRQLGDQRLRCSRSSPAAKGCTTTTTTGPTSARFSRRWSQIDLAWWGIRMLTWMQLVRLAHHERGQHDRVDGHAAVRCERSQHSP